MKEEDILITGSNGLVGSEMKRLYPKAIHIQHKDFDLTNENDVKYMFTQYTPKCVIHLAARVGGVLDNIKNQAVYFDDNVLMNTFMLKHSHINNVEQFIGVLSSCIYPDTFDTYPLQLADLHKGPPTATNFSYGYAKRALAVQIDAYNHQYHRKYQYVMPCNMYGEHDKLDVQKSHFVPALLVKIKYAVDNNVDYITLMGNGKPLRQFMHAKDLAYILKYMVDNSIYDNLNIATPENISIHDMALIALEATGNTHMKIRYDSSKPNGQYRKDISNDVEKIIPGYQYITLRDGMKAMFDYLNNRD